MSAITGLYCPECEQRFDSEQLQTYCRDCNSPLLARYDLDRVGGKPDPEDHLNDIWRWAALLPVHDPGSRLSLGEGGTPLIPAPALASELGLNELLIKDEGGNPSGSFKARGFAVAVSKAIELGATEFVLPTAGNAGGALAVYAARAGATAYIYMPMDAPEVHNLEVASTGAHLELVDGLIDEAGKLASEASERNGAFNMSTFKEPYRVEGKKTMGIELVEQLGWEYPDVIVYPTGGGTGLVGMWKAFGEMETLGWVEGEKPRMVSVQSAGCAPVVRAIEQGAERIDRWEGATTNAHGLRVPGVFADRLVLSAIRDSSGTAVAIPDEEIMQAQRDMAENEGVFPCLEGAATLAGLRQLIEEGWIKKSDKVVLFNTGSGLKSLI